MARNKTTSLPGLERKAIKEIENLADEYADHRDRRMAALAKEVESKATLIAAMHKHDQTEYVFEEDGETVTVSLKSEEKVKVKRGKPGEDDDGD